LTSAKKLFVYGVGRSGLAARAFAMRMVQLGIDCYFIGETITPVVGDGDAVLIVSNTGSTMSAIQVAHIARRVGAKVIAVTGRRPRNRRVRDVSILDDGSDRLVSTLPRFLGRGIRVRLHPVLDRLRESVSLLPNAVHRITQLSKGRRARGHPQGGPGPAGARR